MQTLTVTEASEQSGYKPAYIRKLCHAGTLAHDRRPNGWLLIHRDSLEKHLERTRRYREMFPNRFPHISKSREKVA